MSNIVFIVTDALRPDRLGCYGRPNSITPNIDELAKKGTAFLDNYACINVTDPSLTTIFSGRYPASHGLITHGPHVRQEDLKKLMKSGTRFLPEIMREKNYVTMAVDWLDRWHKKGYDHYSGLRLNFRRMIKIFLRDPTKILNLACLIHRYRRTIPSLRLLYDEITTLHAKELLKKVKNQDFFLFIHYWGTHAPYLAPKGGKITKSVQVKEEEASNLKIKDIDPERNIYHLRWFDDDTSIKEILSRYEGAVNFVDGQIGELMKELRKLGIKDDTLTIVTSDHGESLTEHGIYFDHHGLYDTNLHVPLIFNGPGIPERRRIKAMTQHIDVFPTVLNHLNMRWRERKIDGRDMSPLIWGNSESFRTKIFAEEAEAQRKRAIRTEEYKYIYAKNETAAKCRYCGRIHGDVEELYDIKEDPKEVNNIVGEKREKADRMKREIISWSNKSNRGRMERERIRKRTRTLRKLNRI